jgi:hypothetical protein
MREFSLCSGILSQVAKANPSGLSRVAVITIEVGELAGVDLDSLCFWFPMVVESAERHTYSLRCNIKPGARAAMPAVASLRCMIFISLAVTTQPIFILNALVLLYNLEIEHNLK